VTREGAAGKILILLLTFAGQPGDNDIVGSPAVAVSFAAVI
jgi:hypothetical protein